MAVKAQKPSPTLDEDRRAGGGAIDTGPFTPPPEPATRPALTTELDPRRSTYVSIFGRKGSGKSFLASRLFARYPFDKVVIDPSGDAEGVDDAELLTAPLPAKLPKGEQGRPRTWRFIPDAGADDFRDDLDRVIGLAMHHPRGRCALWLDELNLVSPGPNQTGPNLRRALYMGRHHGLTMFACGPRPMTIDPLVLSQADHVAIFQLPNPNDRRRVADAIGIGPKEFDAWHEQIGEREFFWYDARAHDAVILPPLKK